MPRQNEYSVKNFEKYLRTSKEATVNPDLRYWALTSFLSEESLNYEM